MGWEGLLSTTHVFEIMLFQTLMNAARTMADVPTIVRILMVPLTVDVRMVSKWK